MAPMCAGVMLSAALLATAPAYAVDWTIGLGAGYAPDYEGSYDYLPVPLWNLRASNLQGPTTYVDIFAIKLTSSLVAQVGRYWRPLEDAADILIVADEGDENEYFASLLVATGSGP